MIDLLEIDEKWLRVSVIVAYNGDRDLLTQYHVDNFSFQAAVETTMDMIHIANIDNPMTYYGVELNGEKIGYLCVSQNNLYSFGINIQYRSKKILSEFWEKIKNLLGESFVCMLYPNNTRAIKWLQKCGMVIVEGVEDNCVTLLYHNLKEVPCQ